MSHPDVTIVVPCYNAHQHLAAALDSVRAQTFQNIEILIVDDGSTDPATTAFLAGLPDDIRVIRQENRGLPGARNTGFREAKGEFVLPLDCDDMIAPGMIAACVTALKTAPDVAYAYTQIRLFGDDRGTISKTYNFFEQLATNQLPYCMLIRRNIWSGVGGYDETMRHGYEDWEFNIRLGSRNHFGLCIQEPLFFYRVTADGMLQSISRKRHGALWRDIQKKNRDVYRFDSLCQIWRQWHDRPSSHSLWVVVILLILHRILPNIIFTVLFDAFRRIGRTMRETLKEKTSTEDSLG